jgi:hypothetical protein
MSGVLYVYMPSTSGIIIEYKNEADDVDASASSVQPSASSPCSVPIELRRLVFEWPVASSALRTDVELAVPDDDMTSTTPRSRSGVMYTTPGG